MLTSLCVWSWSAPGAARPNTHAPAISTWDARASNVVLGFGQAVSGPGRFTFASYNANFVSTSGILEAQFGVHYVTYQEDDAAPVARGFSAGGVALINLPLSEAFDNGVPRSAFSFYIGGVPTALFSGQRNFISVPLVLGIGVPFSPMPSLTFTPWAELSPGLSFDTRIQQVSTQDAIESARDGTLTREEVEDLVEEGLDIQRETRVGTRAGVATSFHIAKRLDLDVNASLGTGHSSAVALGAALVFRWDTLVHELEAERPPPPEAPRRGLMRKRPRAERPPPRPHRVPRAGVTAPPARAPAQPSRQPAPARKKKPRSPAPEPPSTAPAKAPAAPAQPGVDALPPLQAAPPRTP